MSRVAAIDVKIGIEDDSRYRGIATLKNVIYIIFQSKISTMK